MELTIILIVILGIVLWPFLLIWSLNILFGLVIGYSLKTYLAALVLTLTVGASGASGRSKS